MEIYFNNSSSPLIIQHFAHIRFPIFSFFLYFLLSTNRWHYLMIEHQTFLRFVYFFSLYVKYYYEHKHSFVFLFQEIGMNVFNVTVGSRMKKTPLVERTTVPYSSLNASQKLYSIYNCTT